MKSLLLYDFVGLYLAIRCNPNYGYPIAVFLYIWLTP